MKVAVKLAAEEFEIEVRKSRKWIMRIVKIYCYLSGFVCVWCFVRVMVTSKFDEVIIIAGYLHMGTAIIIAVSGFIFQRSIEKGFSGAYIRSVVFIVILIWFKRSKLMYLQL